MRAVVPVSTVVVFVAYEAELILQVGFGVAAFAEIQHRFTRRAVWQDFDAMICHGSVACLAL